MQADTNTFWLICLAVSTPIAGVVGFAIQLRTIKKMRLENEKLALEIENLRREQQESARRIMIPSTDEIVKYNEPMFSRGWTGVNPGPDDGPIEKNRRFINAGIELAFYLLLAIFVFYLLFDICRLLIGLWTLFY